MPFLEARDLEGFIFNLIAHSFDLLSVWEGLRRSEATDKYYFMTA